VGGLGVVGLAVGVGFGLSASSSWSSAKSECASTTSCSDHARAVADHDGAANAATLSTIGFVAGGALVAGGLALFLTAPPGETAASPRVGVRLSPGVGRDGAGMTVTGRF
jgi:hypothetical protein